MSDSFAGVKSIFGHAMELHSPEQREAYLAQSCGDDRRLRAEVESLLQAAQDAGGFLDGPRLPLEETAEELPVAERPGTVIGPYKLLEQIGEGGFGVVYMAEQERPVVRKVALKVLKPGMDTRQVVARFEAERQALALMDHPNIAHIHDGGTTTAGRPYFVMELVRGVPITDYCDQSQLSVPARLELFVRVCHAVQHAHTKGVIHRDLKPSNVLVTLHDGAPVPKVIDFGVAKALGQRLTDKTLFTGFAQMVGTPLYMSPEQAEQSGLDVDTRSDVYSLGVLLYELLTGTTPFDGDRMRTAGYDELRRIIREEEPPRPSNRVSTLAQAASTVSENRRSDPRRLSRLLRGELDWVVMKCLEKDRTRRFETVDALANDVERYLTDEPVQACPPSALYRIRKFGRRNKRAMVTAAVLAAAALLAAGSFGWAARDRAARQAEANRESAARQAETDRDLDLALDEAGRERDRGDWPKARAAFQRAERLADAGGSHTRGERVRAMGADLRMAARLEEIRLGEPAMTMLLLHGGQLDPAYAEAFRNYGIDVPALDAPTAAELINASGIRAYLVGALDDWLWAKDCQIYSYGTFGWGGNRLKVPGFQAEYEHLRAVADLATPDELSRRVRDPEVRKNRQALERLADRPDVAGLPPSSVMLLARGLFRVHETNLAVRLLHAAQQRSPDDFLVNHELAVLMPETTPAELEEKIGFMRAAVTSRPRYATLHLKLARMLTKAHRHDQAISAYRTAFELQPSNGHTYSELAGCLESQGKQDEALAVYVQYAASNPQKGGAHIALGNAYFRRRHWDNAIAAFREAIRLSPNDLGAHNKLARILLTCPDLNLRDATGALELAHKAVAHHSAGADSWNTLALAHYRTGDGKAAITAVEKAVTIRTGIDSSDCFVLAMVHQQLNDNEEARKWFGRGVQSMEKDAKSIGRSAFDELPPLRAEAAELLGLKDEPGTHSAPIVTAPLEAELLPITDQQRCKASIQMMSEWKTAQWSNDRQLFCRAEKDGYVELQVEVSRSGGYVLTAHFTKAADFGIIEVTLDGRKMGKSFNGYGSPVSRSREVEFGLVELSEGMHKVRFTVVDKHAKSTNYFMGIDCLKLKPVD